ncbi:hypothetical protein EYZ11_001157 [Aspergillus tanneri]|uniref:Uncharacterized protein n=1 Tax=Aspergillus tanneri TaxID=1220188 RepID=A0A4S3JVB4_9EURO|nr:hypothetical protein EYZ11_001157 [Aspergillus tanneri]
MAFEHRIFVSYSALSIWPSRPVWPDRGYDAVAHRLRQKLQANATRFLLKLILGTVNGVVALNQGIIKEQGTGGDKGWSEVTGGGKSGEAEGSADGNHDEFRVVVLR